MRCRVAGIGLTFFCMVVFSAAAYAQQAGKTFFVYIQNEAGTPFYVRNRDSLMSSSPAGYLIIPRLQKGQYRLTIGFPRNQMPEASFGIDVSGSADQGFLIRRASGGFDLVSLQDSHVVKPLAVASAPGNRIIPTPASTAAPHKKAGKKQPATPSEPASGVAAASNTVTPPPAPAAAEDTGAFSRMLNQITGTSNPAPSAPPASPKKQVREVADTPAVAAALTPQNDQPRPQTPPVQPPAGTRQSESGIAAPAVIAAEAPAAQASSPPEPQFITFTPDSAATTTPSQAVPAPTPATDGVSAPVADSVRRVKRQERQLRREALDAEKQAEKQAEKKAEQPDTADVLSPFIAAAAPESQSQQPAPVTAPAGKTADSLQTIPNSDCSRVAGEEEFQKVRRKMASRSSEQSMLNVAEKYFNGGFCYTTSQIQSLAYLFMTDEYKYRFLELAYAHTADSRNFPSLIGTLGDAYYRDRFKAMVK